MDDNKIENQIKQILPSLSEDKIKALIQRLVDLGVADYSHLNLVEEKDINDVVKTIEARLLIRSWKNKEIESNIVILEEKRPEQPSSPSFPQVQENPCPKHNFDWAYNYEVQWKSLPSDIMKPLEENKRLTPSLRRNLIKIVTDDIRKFSTKPGRKGLGIIARKMVEKHTASLADYLCDQIVGEGHNSLLKQMENRFDNFNRVSPYHVLKRSMRENSEGDTKNKLSNADAYGCVNWQPSHLPVHETEETQEGKRLSMIEMSSKKEINVSHMKTLLNDTYYSQRKTINSKMNILDVKREWPLIFRKEGLCHHFQILMEFDVLQKLNDSLTTKGLKVFKFLKTLPAKNKKEKMKEVLDSSSVDNENPDLPTLITLLTIYFDEDIKELFTTVDITRTVNEVESMELPITPHLVCYGADVMNASSYSILIDRKIVIDNASSFIEGFSLMFISFYCFNIHYPKRAAVTLEFVQRCFLGINPNRGSKANPEIKKKECINVKILNFLNKLSECEFIDC